jgi:hypothetical protein
MEFFAVKFGDIIRRRRILFGSDPFAAVSISRESSITRVRQTLLNLTLRMRGAYIGRGCHEEQRVAMIANMAGPLRSCAATIMELEGANVNSAREAFYHLAASLTDAISSAELLKTLSEARQTGILQPGTSEAALLQLIDLASRMCARAATLK